MIQDILCILRLVVIDKLHEVFERLLREAILLDADPILMPSGVVFQTGKTIDKAPVTDRGLSVIHIIDKFICVSAVHSGFSFSPIKQNRLQ